MSNEERRIKLAKATGWKVENADRIYSEPTIPNGRYGHLPHMSVGAPIPDPFTDANDDYAVLVFARKWGLKKWDKFYEHLPTCLADDYQIGDYARAALKVLGVENAVRDETFLENNRPGTH